MSSTNNTTHTASVIGVDLGSSSIKVAAVQNGAVDIITNEANLRQTPNVVGYGCKERLIGDMGYSKLRSNHKNTVSAATRLLGLKPSADAQYEMKYSVCPTSADDGQIEFEVTSGQKTLKLTSQQVTAALLSQVEKMAQLNKLDAKSIVLTVPGYWTQAQRQALLSAAEVSKVASGKDYSVGLVCQSEAIGMEYGFYKKKELPEMEEQAQDVLFIDFGHSKLSLYVLRFTKNYGKMVYQKHLEQTGCREIDLFMFEFYSSLFEEAHPELTQRVRDNKKASIKLMDAIEKQRKVLTGNSEYELNIECLLEDEDISFTMTRQKFEAISQPVLDKISAFLAQVGKDLEVNQLHLGRIELLGGGSRVPAFIKLVSSVFGIEPSRTLNSSECFAKGAGLKAAMSSRIFRIQPYHFIGQNNQKMILNWKYEGEDMQNEANSVVVLDSQQTLYHKKTVKVELDPSKEKVSMELRYAFCSEAVDSLISSFQLFLEKNEDETTGRQVELEFEFDQNQLLSAPISVLDTQAKAKIRIEPTKQHESDIKKWIETERDQRQRDTDIIKGYQRRNMLQTHLYTVKEKLQTMKSSESLAHFINPEELSVLEESFVALEQNTQALQNQQERLRDLQIKVSTLAKESEEAKEVYEKTEKAVDMLRSLLKNFAQAKLKEGREMPEQIREINEWVNRIVEEATESSKHQGYPTTVGEVQQAYSLLKQKIQQDEEANQRRQRVNYGRQPQHYREVDDGQRRFVNPFMTHTARTQPRRRNMSYGGMLPGFFF